jgi:hypothetical protein
MASDRIHSEILRRAAEVVGGEARLAQHLDVGAGGLYLIALDILSRSSSAPEQKKAPTGSSLAGL